MQRGKWALILIMIGAFSVRLIQIDQPFVDPWSWRQSDVAAIARNFLENGFHFARPRIDWAGNEPGYVGTEFPMLPFVAALIYKSIGVQEWIGRIQGVLFFVAALPFFFLLVRRVFGEAAAVWATFFYAFAPLGIVASRAFMPDVPSLSLAIAGMYFYLRWLEEDRFKWLLSSALLISLALLIKLPTALIGAPLLYLAFRRDSPRRVPDVREHVPPVRTPAQLLFRWELWLFAMITLLPSALWYWHAHQIAEAFYPHHFFGAGGFRIMNAAWYGEIARQTVISSLTPLLFAFAVIGAFVMPRGKYTRLFHWWLAAMVPFVLFVGWGNRHQWYQLPFVPIAAVFAGCACAWFGSFLRPRRFVAAMVAVVTAAFLILAYRSAQPFYRSSAASLRKLGVVLKEATTKNALIIAATDGDPTVFYYAHRKGWHFPGDGIYEGHPLDNAQLIDNFEKFRARGATHLVFYAGTRWWLDYYREFADRLAASATLVEETPEFTIFRLNPGSILPPP